MRRRTPAQRTIAAFSVVLVIVPWSDPAFAGPIAVSGTVNQSGTVTNGGTALTNPPGPDETRGVIEIDLAAIRALVPNSTIGDSSLSLVGVQFDVAKTFEIYTYGADVALTETDYGAGGAGTPSFSHAVTGPTGLDGLTFTLDLTPADFSRAAGIGFSLRESESSGNALIAVEWVFVATILALGVITGLTTIETPAVPQFGPDGLPNGLYEFGVPEVTFTQVPEPASMILLSLGAALVLVHRRRRREA